MSWIVRHKSEAYRLREAGRVKEERIGPLHEDAPMLEWGSITKTVTAGLAEQLHHAGAVDLSAPVSDYLPQTGLPQSIDVLSLVEHTSGLPRLPLGHIRATADARDPYVRYTTELFDAEILPGLADRRRRQPGTFDYSNLGYAVLTRLLEVVAEDGWWTLAKRHVFTPIGITDVSICPDPRRVPVLQTWTGRICQRWTFSGPFIGTGGLHGTFEALERFATARMQQTPRYRPLGWMDNGDLHWHSGGTLDHSAFVGVSHDGSRVITAHTLGHRHQRVGRIAARLQRHSLDDNGTDG